MSNEPERIADRYEIQEVIGEGGMGLVYKGLDTATNAAVAIKQLKTDAATQEKSVVERFEREAEALRRLNHPNIVKVLDTVPHNGSKTIIMEYVPGGTLRNLLEKGEPIPLRRSLEIMLELTDALIRAHHLNIIHRDIKPGNVLLADDGTPRLTDFGVAHMEHQERITDVDISIGTLDYIAPEVLDGQDNDKRSDIWSFGVLMYELLTGNRPFSRPTISQTITSILHDEPEDMRNLNPNIPQGLVYLVDGMMMRDRDLRIGSMRQVSAELESIILAEDDMPTLISRFRTPTALANDMPGTSLDTPVVGVDPVRDSYIEIQKRHNRQSAVSTLFLVAAGALMLMLIVTVSAEEKANTDIEVDLQHSALIVDTIEVVNRYEPPSSVPSLEMQRRAVEKGWTEYSNDLYSFSIPPEWTELNIANTLDMLSDVTEGSDTFTAIIGESDMLDLITAEILSGEGVAIRRQELADEFDNDALLGWVPFVLHELKLPLVEDSATIVDTPMGEMVQAEIRVSDRYIGPDKFLVYFTMQESTLYWIIFYTQRDAFDELMPTIEDVLLTFDIS